MARKQVKFEINPLLGGPSLANRSRSGSPYRELPLSEIDVDPDQPRRMFSPDALEQLSASIKEHGLLSPVLVRVTAGGTYRIIAGERRFRASKMAGLETIPAIIDSSEDSENVLAKQLVENIQREELSPIERSYAIGQLKEQSGWSIREVAAALGVSKGLVQRSLEILSLPEDLQEALAAGASESKVLLLGQVEDLAARTRLVSKLDDLSRAQVEAEVRALNEAVGVKKKPYRGGTDTSSRSKLSVEDRRIAEEIQRTLGTRVQLTRKDLKSGHGKLTIEFYSSSDLYELYRRLTS